MKLNPYLSLAFNGQCEAAFKFYEQCLGANITFMLRWGDSPMANQSPPHWREKIIHARLRVGDTDLLGGDVLSEQYEEPKGFSVLLEIEDPADAERIFQALAEKGAVQMPLQTTFWARRFGVVVDQFGT